MRVFGLHDPISQSTPPGLDSCCWCTGRKFYMAPNLVTQTGPARSVKPRPASTLTHHPDALLADITLHMEAAGTLTLRFPGLLRPDTPAHQPILQLLHSEQQEPAAVAGAEAAGGAAAAPVIQSPTSILKQIKELVNAASLAPPAHVRPEVKPESRPRKRQKATPTCIDLTM